MTSNFLQSIDLSDQIYASGSLIVSHQKGNADGSFVLHHLLADFVKRYGTEAGILLVLSNENISHWSSIGHKLGWNLNTHAAKGALTVVDLTQDIYKALTGMGNCSRNEPQVTQEIRIDIDSLFNFCKESIVSRISNNLGKSDGDGSSQANDHVSSSITKFLVIVDDLTTVQYCTSTSSDVSGERATLKFLQNLLTLSDGLHQDHSVDMCLATCVNSCGGLFSSTVAQTLSSLLFEISPLHTGYSQLFSGYITVKRKSEDISDQETSIKSYQFKLEERQVKFSPLTKYIF